MHIKLYVSVSCVVASKCNQVGKCHVCAAVDNVIAIYGSVISARAEGHIN